MAAEADPAVAAAAALYRQQAEAETGLQREPDGNVSVPGFTRDPTTPEPLLAQDAPQQQAQPEPEAEVQVPSYEANIDGIEDLLTEPDVEDDDEPVGYTEDVSEDDFSTEDDPRLLKRIRQLEKKNAWLEERAVNASIKNWRAEAAKRFPLAAPEVENIEGKSRKEVLRKAQSMHDIAHKILAPHLKTLQEAQGQAQTMAREEAREYAKERWGTPSAGPPQPMIEHAQSAAEEQALDRRNFRTLADRVGALMKAGKLEI